MIRSDKANYDTYDENTNGHTDFCERLSSHLMGFLENETKVV